VSNADPESTPLLVAQVTADDPSLRGAHARAAELDGTDA